VGTDGMPVTLDTELPMMTTGPLPWCDRGGVDLHSGDAAQPKVESVALAHSRAHERFRRGGRPGRARAATGSRKIAVSRAHSPQTAGRRRQSRDHGLCNGQATREAGTAFGISQRARFAVPWEFEAGEHAISTLAALERKQDHVRRVGATGQREN
jgi:hypothetical protein